jgi:hypothetical protein
MLLIALSLFMAVMFIPTMGYVIWMRERHRIASEREEERQRQDTREMQQMEAQAARLAEERDQAFKKLKMESELAHRRQQAEADLLERRLQADERARYEARQLEEERIAAAASGPGSGGYIVVDMPDSDRPCFTIY